MLSISLLTIQDRYMLRRMNLQSRDDQGRWHLKTYSQSSLLNLETQRYSSNLQLYQISKSKSFTTQPISQMFSCHPLTLRWKALIVNDLSLLLISHHNTVQHEERRRCWSHLQLRTLIEEDSLIGKSISMRLRCENNSKSLKRSNDKNLRPALLNLSCIDLNHRISLQQHKDQ